MHIMVQETWIPKWAQAEKFAGKDPDKKDSSDPEGCTLWGCASRDAATLESLQDVHVKQELPYRNALRTQLTGINTNTTTGFATVVPVWDLVLSMRERKIPFYTSSYNDGLRYSAVIANKRLPGVPKQTDLFMDNLGHAKKPLRDAASYMWFAALYNINPQGMKSLVSSSDDPALAGVLQKLAWDTLQKEPLNGLPK